MIIKDIGDRIVFDTLPLNFDPKRKIILTNLLHIEKQTIPEKLNSIFTTKVLARRFEQFCSYKGYKCIKKDTFVYVEPYTEIEIFAERHRKLQIMFCEGSDFSGNLMVLIKEGGKCNNVYVGNFTDLRTAMLNTVYNSWMTEESIQYLYLNLKKCEENSSLDTIDQREEVLDNVQKLLEYYPNRINIYIPSFGYENFIEKISRTYYKRVGLSEDFKFLLQIDSEYMCKSIEDSRIALFPGNCTNNAYLLNKTHQQITVDISEGLGFNEFSIVPDIYYYKFKYSPEPSVFDLQHVCIMMNPKRIFGIIDTFNINSKVPKYLKDLCVGQSPQVKRQSKLNISMRALSQQTNKDCVKSVVVGPLSKDFKHQCRGVYLSDSDTD